MSAFRTRAVVSSYACSGLKIANNRDPVKARRAAPKMRTRYLRRANSRSSEAPLWWLTLNRLPYINCACAVLAHHILEVSGLALDGDFSREFAHFKYR